MNGSSLITVIPTYPAQHCVKTVVGIKSSQWLNRGSLAVNKTQTPIIETQSATTDSALSTDCGSWYNKNTSLSYSVQFGRSPSHLLVVVGVQVFTSPETQIWLSKRKILPGAHGRTSGVCSVQMMNLAHVLGYSKKVPSITPTHISVTSTLSSLQLTIAVRRNKDNTRRKVRAVERLFRMKDRSRIWQGLTHFGGK